MTGPELGTRVWIYDRAAGSSTSPAVLSGPNYEQSPSISASGRYVVVERERSNELVGHMWVFDRQTGSFTPQSPTWAGGGETLPAIADPAVLVDITPPKLALKCSRKGAKVSCTLTVNEPITGTATLLVGRHKKTARSLRASAPRVIRFKLSLGRAVAKHLSLKVAVKDTSGNAARASAGVR